MDCWPWKAIFPIAVISRFFTIHFIQTILRFFFALSELFVFASFVLASHIFTFFFYNRHSFFAQLPQKMCVFSSKRSQTPLQKIIRFAGPITSWLNWKLKAKLHSQAFFRVITGQHDRFPYLPDPSKTLSGKIGKIIVACLRHHERGIQSCPCKSRKKRVKELVVSCGIPQKEEKQYF